MHRQAAADAGAEDHREHGRGACRGAVGRLGEGQAVGIIGERDRALEDGREIPVERFAVEPGGVRILEQPGGGGDGPRRAEPDGATRAELGFDLGHQVPNCR